MGSFAGTGALTKLALRRDRIMLPAWVYILTASAASTAYSFKGLYKTAAAREHFAEVNNRTSGTLVLAGRVYDSSIGGLTTWKVSLLGAAMTGLMSIFIVVRHTRAEEEEGRLELLGAGVVGRLAALTSALLIAVGANLVLALLISIGLVALGLPAAGAVAMGLSWAAVGLFFAGCAAVTAQLSESARTAKGIATAVLLVSYLLRAVGDAASAGGPRWASWLSPLGWAEQIRPFGDERWWVFGLLVVFAAGLAAGAYTLEAERDLGAGLIPPRPGPATAPPMLRSSFALAWRLQRGPLLAWAIGFAAFGVAMGSLAKSIDDLLGTTKSVRDAVTKIGGQQGIVDSYLAATMGFFGLAAAVYAVQAVLRLRSEETGQRAEPLLAATVGRVRWALGHLVIAVSGTAVILALAGLGAGLAYGVSIHDVGTQAPRLTGAALVQLPAVLVIAAVAVVLFGFVPRASVAGWGALVVCVLLGQFGPLLKLGQGVLDISPFTHLPKSPGGAFTATPLVWLAAIAVALTLAGLAGFRRRDLT